MTDENEQQLFDIQTSCRRLGNLGRAKLYEEIRAGRLKTVKIGTRRFVSREGEAEYVRLLKAEAAASVEEREAV